MRLWIATILLFVFACQALPLAVFGTALSKVQLSIIDDDAADGDGDGSTPDTDAIKLKKQSALVEDDLIHHSAEASALCAIQAAQLLFLHRADHLPVIYAGEVTTPPPDHC
jgi:hypothetical protein